MDDEHHEVKDEAEPSAVPEDAAPEDAEPEDGATEAESGDDAAASSASETDADAEDERSVEAVEDPDGVPGPQGSGRGPSTGATGAGSSPSTPRPRWMIAGQLLLAPLLAAGAVGVHWWLNVPEKIIESPRDQGAKGKKKKKRNARQARDRNRRRSEARNRTRTPEQLEGDWERYQEVPFEDEPTEAIWARRHQALINRAVVVARHAAFEGAPEQPRVVLADTKCRTVRCRFTLRSPYRHELDVISGALSRLQSNDEDVWRSYEAVAAEATADDEDDQPRVRVTVAFRTDDTDTRGLGIPEQEPESESESESGSAAPDDATPDEAKPAPSERAPGASAL